MILSSPSEVRLGDHDDNHSAMDKIMADNGSRYAGSSSSEAFWWFQTSGRSCTVNGQSSIKAIEFQGFHHTTSITPRMMDPGYGATYAKERKRLCSMGWGDEKSRIHSTTSLRRRIAVGKRDRLTPLFSHQIPVNHSNEQQIPNDGDFVIASASIHKWMTSFYKSWSTRKSLEYLRGQMFTSSS